MMRCRKGTVQAYATTNIQFTHFAFSANNCAQQEKLHEGGKGIHPAQPLSLQVCVFVQFAKGSVVAVAQNGGAARCAYICEAVSASQSCPKHSSHGHAEDLPAVQDRGVAEAHAWNSIYFALDDDTARGLGKLVAGRVRPCTTGGRPGASAS